MNDAPRFLIVRLSAIGDVVHGMPVACALRDTFPNAYIGWIVESVAAPLLEGHKALDTVIVVPRGWLKSPGSVLQARRRLIADHYEVSIDLQGLTKSAFAAWLSGAKNRIGFSPPDGREISPWLNTDCYHASADHIVDKNLELLSTYGVNNDKARFELPVSGDAAAKVDGWIGDTGMKDTYGVVNPGAGWPSKRWPPSRYAEVCEALHGRSGMKFVVTWAGTEERVMAESIVKLATDAAGLAPATDLRELAALLRRAAVFIGSDTGPLHIAAALGTPCIGLYGPMPAERNGPFGAHCVVVQKMRIDGSARDRRRAGPESMDAIEVNDVLDAFEKLTAENRIPC